MLLSSELERAYIQQEWILARDIDGNVSVLHSSQAEDNPAIAYMYPYRSEIEDFSIILTLTHLWSSGQSSWLQILRPGFDSRHYQKKNVVGLERGALSLLSTN
jgi:hypothetical protein